MAKVVPHSPATQFKKGQTGNPNGRPKLPDLRELMDEIMGEEKDGKTAAQAILMKLRHTAMTSSNSQGIRAAELLMNRGYGLPKQAIDLNNTGETVIRIIRDKEL